MVGYCSVNEMQAHRFRMRNTPLVINLPVAPRELHTCEHRKCFHQGCSRA
uniref:Uncharacterized protein n=1 Tax=Anguilla anguilla TaxID=7936 RepID=A0A0E9UNV2_ANGAN